MEQFPLISRQTDDRIELKSGRQTHYGPLLAWLLVTLQWIPDISWHLIAWTIFVHWQTKRWSDLAQIRWTNSIWASLIPINFRPCFAESQLRSPQIWLNPSGGTCIHWCLVFCLAKSAVNSILSIPETKFAANDGYPLNDQYDFLWNRHYLLRQQTLASPRVLY